MALGPGDALSDERPLRMVDLGCGNAYLTFAAFRYLTAVRGLPVEGVGVDVKAQSRAFSTDVAERLGVGDRLGFVEGTIGDAEVAMAPDLVMALHACDTATDDALGAGGRLGGAGHRGRAVLPPRHPAAARQRRRCQMPTGS